ncbi:Formyltransferase [Lentithecium fluviatile CBS 122367]|uniref:methionyl-tRNA formyltransferase n=1 Tax=Lentithecium fluviatile CBS 122367 TaxID=1168545 RepID=A0A6G1IGK4_9PLEO|nr:Formyltransferase [Lentithecium fluviatile CBS 122367]
MLWRRPAPVRSLLVSNCHRYSSAVTKTAEPLRILFCGSDEFSIASLRALSKARRDVPELIESIDIVHRPAKPTGRGGKRLRPVPIQEVAKEELRLNTHAIDTFTGWTPPVPIHLVIAVSFGLFVPPRILNLARYGGLNVHPSLLPDLRGPAPIHHALLKERPSTGVSIQTLHPKHFDRGTILAQTPPPGIQLMPGTTTAELTETLANQGAGMLVDVLKSGAFVPPLEDVGWYSSSDRPIHHAEKITKKHREIDFNKDALHDILKVHRVIGAPYCLLPNGARLILDTIADQEDTISAPSKVSFMAEDGTGSIIVRLGNGEALRIDRSTYEGGKTGQGNARLIRLINNKLLEI